MKHCEGSFNGTKGLKLYYQSWHPSGQAKGIVLILHGLGSHSSLFINVIQSLVPSGYTVYGLDLRGHGRSQGQRGHINTWSEFRDDLKLFFTLIKTLEKGIPCFLLGHSLGGIIALDYVLRFPAAVQGVVTMAPPLGKLGISPIKLILGKALSQVAPRFALNVGFVDAAIYGSQQGLATLPQDPFLHSQGSARLATEFLAINNWLQSHTAELQVPILILHGGADQISRPEGSRAFFDKIKFPDKERYEYPGICHALHRDRNYQEAVNDLKNWLERHRRSKPLIPFNQQLAPEDYISA